ncbi:GNAT family N-acetyltransferase [Falsibacillus albus]|uniref:GNAT family N-acetyltransferase n=1 Tax=Falsibacillus albus TaxID=2478915 RepID=A0A3L7K1R4_9BACI|nr:GNAT family N-acetyltransferase [Falsibacillus albus]RLQ96294.1 GNAT family N-acetyltransferase [Falsibacillus albus]
MDYIFVKGYQENEELRTSFNHLAQRTFGINFENWHKNGFWTEKYIPYSLEKDGEIVANVSANLLTLIIDGKEIPAIQIGTVMTAHEHRNKGLSKWLMNKVMEDYEHEVDIIYLFANSSVLDFYPKFGFEPIQETQFFIPCSGETGCQLPLRKLDPENKNDLTFIYDFVSKRVTNSKTFTAARTTELFMFYCIYVFSDNIYYHEEDEVLAIAKQEEEELHIFDLVLKQEKHLHNTLQKLTTSEIKKIVLHFTPMKSADIHYQNKPFVGSEVLFVKHKNKISFPAIFKHPLTSQA